MFKNLIYEYQQLLLGRSLAIPTGYFVRSGEGFDRKNEMAALAVIRYAVEVLLNWTPEQVRDRMAPWVLEKMKLTRIAGFVIFPPETNRNKDFFIYAHKLYPDIIHIDRRALIINTYNDILEGQLVKFPKGFFDDNLGRIRAQLCLNYVVSQKLTFEGIDDLYKTFASQSGKQIIRKYRLELAQKISWDTPLDFLHDSLSAEDKNETWYHFYKLGAELTN